MDRWRGGGVEGKLICKNPRTLEGTPGHSTSVLSSMFFFSDVPSAQNCHGEQLRHIGWMDGWGNGSIEEERREGGRDGEWMDEPSNPPNSQSSEGFPHNLFAPPRSD